MGMTYERDAVIRDLRQNVIEVTFIKINGEQRVMRCTLDPQYLPPNYDPQHLDEQHKKKENLSTIAAWDLNAQGWRSFRVDSVQYLQSLEGGF
jgi:hypothetical protein